MYALDILVSPKAGHIWLDLEFGAWCWDFAAYRTSNIQPSTELSIEPIVIPLPQSLVASLKAGYCTHGSARNLAEIICAIQGKDRVDLKQFRQYLRDIGDEAHPPYRGRLANSLAHAILEVTGSDMMSTLLTAQFPAVAPAALFYFGPTYQVVYQRLSQLYERLGLGNHTTPKPLDERTGGHRIPPNEVVLKGWILLVDRIEVERHQVSKARSFDEARIAVNTLMRYLCAAFIIQCGHRGSRLDQLSFGALASSDSFMVIHDKELNDQFLRAQPRLLPKTAIIRTVVEIALDCHSLMAKRSGLQDPKPRSLDTPAFAQFEGSEKIEVHPVHTRDVAGLIFEMFDGAPINFSRSVWVTSLDSFGCDRWLIRAFTGHARDITRTSGPFFDVPVTEAAKRLKDSMEAIGPKVFGDCAPTRSEKTCARKMQLPRIQGLEQARSKKQFPDPIATLIPVTQDILVAAELAKSLRSAIFNGSLATEPAESLLLHLLFVDLCPNTDVALLAVCEPPARFVEELVRPALKWDRDHFIHPVLLPLTSPSAQLLGILDDKKTTKSVLLSGLVRALQLVAGHHPEISTAEGIWENLSFWSQSFRRLYLPPSMLGCSHPEIPAPCLNLGSWQRLSGVFPKNLQVSAISPHTTKSTTYQKSSDVKELGKVLNHFSDSTLRLGEKRQRAIDAIKAINCIELLWTPIGLWLKDWLQDELARSRDGTNGSYQLSSLATYYSSLTQVRNIQALEDPREWEEDEWRSYIAALHMATTNKPLNNGEPVCDRTRHSSLAVIHSLNRRGLYVPRGIYSLLSEGIDKLAKVDSASSILITTKDNDTAQNLIAHWLTEEPDSLLLSQIRSHIEVNVPVRASDLGNLKRKCLTASGGLIIGRSGFNDIKNEQSIRVWPIGNLEVTHLTELRQMLMRYQPIGDLLLRGSGTPLEVQDDIRVAELMNQALKCATGDPRARRHSMRATTLQNLAWPGWQGIARKYLRGELGNEELNKWVEDDISGWTTLAQACFAAGHSGITTALSNYLAGWPAVHALLVHSINSTCEVTPRYTHSIGLSDAALRKARSRSKSAQRFSTWDWYERQVFAKGHWEVVDDGDQVESEKFRPLAESNTTNVVTKVAELKLQGVPKRNALRYLGLRCLSMPFENAIGICKLNQSTAFALEGVLPTESINTSLVRRARAGPEARGISGNIRLLQSDLGEGLLAWVEGLDSNVLDFASQVFIRESPEDRSVLSKAMWSSLAACLPQATSILVQRGKAHMSDSELSNYLRSQRVEFRAARDLGFRPFVSIVPLEKTNRVLQSRLTSIARVLILCTKQLAKLNEAKQ